MPEQLATQIEQFIGHVGKYFEWESYVKMTPYLYRSKPGYTLSPKVRVDVEQSIESQEREAANIRRVGTTLAQSLDAAGHDSTGVLRAVHCADGGGGVAALAPLWAEIKVGLQRVAMQPAEVPTVKPQPTLHETAQCIADYITEHPGCVGKQVASACYTSDENVRRIVSKKLKPLGFTNDQSTGYHPPNTV